MSLWEWLPSFHPRHSFKAVLRELYEGLQSGNIVLEKHNPPQPRSVEAEAEKFKAETDAIRESAKAVAEKIKSEAAITHAMRIAEAHGLEAEAQSKQAEADRKKLELQDPRSA